MSSAVGSRRGLTVRPLQPALRDVFDSDAQRDQFGQRGLVGVRRLDAAERPLQTIADGIGLTDELVGWRRSLLARCAGIRLSTHRRHCSARDFGTAVQQTLNLLGVFGVQLAEFMQRARRCDAPALQRLIEFGRKLQQGKVMRHSRQIHAEAFGHGGVRVARISTAADEPGQVERCQPMTLLVLRDLGVGIGRCIAYDNGHFMQSGSDRRAQPLGAEVDAVAAVRVTRVSRVPNTKTSTRRPAAIAANANCRSARARTPPWPNALA